MSENKKENCKGCFVTDHCNNVTYNKICPCVKCIVKVTCVMGCYEYDKFAEESRVKEDKGYKEFIEDQWVKV